MANDAIEKIKAAEAEAVVIKQAAQAKIKTLLSDEEKLGRQRCAEAEIKAAQAAKDACAAAEQKAHEIVSDARVKATFEVEIITKAAKVKTEEAIRLVTEGVVR